MLFFFVTFLSVVQAQDCLGFYLLPAVLSVCDLPNAAVLECVPEVAD